MASRTFKGGLALPEYKNTKDQKIEYFASPETLCIPMNQHVGRPARPIVVPGEHVRRGQRIALADGELSADIHTAVSGTVTGIQTKTDASGRSVLHVVIQNDFQNELFETVKPVDKRISEMSSTEIIEIVKNAGIVGMGGAMFPTHVKLASAVGRTERLIINCAECEPYLTSNHRLLLENTAAIIGGTKIIMRALGVYHADFAVENNKRNAIAKLKQLCKGRPDLFNVHSLKTKYPQGDERQLIYALYRKKLPVGKLPIDAGCVVFNAETVFAIYNAFAKGMPLCERVVTVDGDCISNPKCIRVPIGTPYIDLFRFCGGLCKVPREIICGGPMMGVSQWDAETPVIKGTTGVLAFSGFQNQTQTRVPTCIRCGRCVNICPMRLMPNYLVSYAKSGDTKTCRALYAQSCVECGLCSYYCPGDMPIVQYIRIIKAKIKEEDTFKALSTKRTEPVLTDKRGDDPR